MRLINADMAQEIADRELSAQDAGAVQFVLSHTPTIEAMPVVHGRWVKVDIVPNYMWNYRCSCCHSNGERRYNYCSNCGAKMDLDLKEG